MYNYILKDLNIIKINFKIKNTIKIKVAKKYQSSNINKNIKEIKHATNKTVLKNTSRVYLDLKKIDNANAL